MAGIDLNNLSKEQRAQIEALAKLVGDAISGDGSFNGNTATDMSNLNTTSDKDNIEFEDAKGLNKLEQHRADELVKKVSDSITGNSYRGQGLDVSTENELAQAVMANGHVRFEEEQARIEAEKKAALERANAEKKANQDKWKSAWDIDDGDDLLDDEPVSDFDEDYAKTIVKEESAPIEAQAQQELAENISDIIGDTVENNNNTPEDKIIQFPGGAFTEPMQQQPVQDNWAGFQSTGAVNVGQDYNEYNQDQNIGANIPYLREVRTYKDVSKLSLDEADINFLKDKLRKEFKRGFKDIAHNRGEFGIHNFCYDISIQHLMFGDEGLEFRTAEQERFYRNYSYFLDTNQIKPDNIPSNQTLIQNMMRMDLTRQHDMTINDLLGSDVGSGYSNANNEDAIVKERQAPSETSFKVENGITILKSGNSILRSIKIVALDNNNFADSMSASDANKGVFGKLWGRSPDTRSRIYKARTNAVIDQLKKIFQDPSAVTRIMFIDNNLVVNGMMVDISGLMDDNVGIRFEDIVNVKDIISVFNNVEKLTIDNTMFDQMVSDLNICGHPERALTLFQVCKRLKMMEIQLTPGGAFEQVTRSNYREKIQLIAEGADERQFAKDMEAVAAAKNPRLADKGWGYADSAFGAAKNIGSSALNQLTMENPRLFRAGVLGIVGLGTVAVAAALKLGQFGIKVKRNGSQFIRDAAAGNS